MNHQGFTLLDLLVSVAIISILLTVGVPSVKATLRDAHLTTLANDLLGALILARSEAIRRGVTVVVCKSADGIQCGGLGWDMGWIVFVNSDEDSPPVVDTTEEILRRYEALPANYSLAANHNFVNQVSYRPTGRSNTMGRFVFCHDQLVKDHSRALFVSISGRARVADDENHNGIPDWRNADNEIVDITACSFNAG